MTGSACSEACPQSPASSPGDHAPVDGAQHGVGRARIAERALLGHHGRGLAAVLGVGGESVRGERVGHHVHGGPDGALPFGRRHAGRQRAPVLLADVGRHLLGLLRPQPLHGFGQEAHEEIVPALHQPDRQLLLYAEVLLGGSSGSGGLARRLHPEVPPVDQALEVVAGHVGVEGEGGGHLGRRHAGCGPDVQEDVAAGRVAEGGRNSGHGGA